MTNLLRNRLMAGVAFAPENEGGSDAAAAAASDAGAEKAAQSTTAEKTNVLYPDDKPKTEQPAGLDKDGKPAATDKPAAAAAWKEYEADPNKTDDENAAAKAEHDKTKPADAAATDDAKLDTVPEDGKYSVQMPEGIELDTKLLDRFSPKFKEAGLTQRQVQAISTEFAAMRKEEVEAHMSTPEGAWSAAAHEYFKENGSPDAWADKAKADKEIGGANWNGTVASAQRAVNTLGTPELKQFFEASGGGNHPELIRFMAKVGAMIKEDNPATGNASGGKKADRLEVLYPNDKPKGK